MNEAKAALAQWLQQECSFTAIGFESSFTAGVVTWLNKEPLDTRTRRLLYPFWNTASVRAFLDSFASQEQAAGRPLITGFDIQEDCRFVQLSDYFYKNGLLPAHHGELAAGDSVLARYIGKHYSQKGPMTKEECRLLTEHYERLQSALAPAALDTTAKKLLLRCFDNRKWLCQYLTLSSSRERMYYRDSLMASNIQWLKETIYPGKKLILWAANTHVSKSSPPARWTGEWLTAMYAQQYFAIGLEKGKAGNHFNWQNKVFQYTLLPSARFDMMIYLDKLKKIKSQEWITPCD